jgi:hypothetical protein
MSSGGDGGDNIGTNDGLGYPYALVEVTKLS